LQEATAELVAQFNARILSFDQDSAHACRRVFAGTQAAGNPIHFGDCAITAIAIWRGFMLATRNVRDYKGADIELINPWNAP
jgi:predicted nucleic acid-binding protein